MVFQESKWGLQKNVIQLKIFLKCLPLIEGPIHALHFLSKFTSISGISFLDMALSLVCLNFHQNLYLRNMTDLLYLKIMITEYFFWKKILRNQNRSTDLAVLNDVSHHLYIPDTDSKKALPPWKCYITKTCRII